MSIPPALVALLTSDYEYASELQALGMAFQGAMAVRNGANRERKMNWFHAFALTTMLSFGGGWLGFMLMGKPTSMVSGGDINVSACALAFLLVNYTPFDIGYKVLSFLPCKILITVYAQLFRSNGMIGFINTAFKEIKPTRWYPIPVVGPVVYGTMLGNMGGLALKGFDNYLKHGIPWPFQNGIVIGTFYHLFSHDTEGPLGRTLRSLFKRSVDDSLILGLDDTKFAHVFTAGFMQVAGLMMLPQFFGPSFSLIADPLLWIGRAGSKRFESKSVDVQFSDAELSEKLTGNSGRVFPPRKKSKKKKKTA